MRKVSLVVAAAAALLCFAAVALAQTNTYTVSGKIASGGSKSKPKPVGVVFKYTVGEASGNLASPVKTYGIHFDGLRFNTKVVAGGKYCTAESINAAASDSGCSAKTKVGTGEVKAFVGNAGKPITPTNKCDLDLDIYAGGPKSLALFLHAVQPQCLTAINQAIDAKLKVDSTGTSLTFTVPPVPLLHPVTGLDASVTSVSSNIKKIGSGTKGLFTSVGCKSKRKVKVTFTSETGQKGTAEASAGKC